ncbi:MAG: transporter substrate-binding protein [Paenibacillus sp.]|nr:transporter substrate-binding protein [Paenibacillus sp.]
MQNGGVKKAVIPSLLAIVFLTAAGCSDQTTDKAKSPEPQKESTEPVTLKLYDIQSISDENLEKWFNGPLRKKYPYIKVEKIDKTNNPLVDVIAAKQQVDLVMSASASIPSNMSVGIQKDMTLLLKNSNFDLSRFDPKALDFIRLLSNGGLFALPYSGQIGASYYNKDIFDKFGTAYPTDGMTWTQVIEMGKKLTRNEGGVQYRGFQAQDLIRLIFPLSLNVINPSTNRSEINTAPYKRAFEVGKSIDSIPGNKPYETGGIFNAFLKNQTLAMVAATNWLTVPDFVTSAPNMNWDIAQYPSYEDRPNTFTMYDLQVLSMSGTTKYENAVMKLFEVFFSEEVQMQSSRSGAVPIFQDPKYKAAFAADLPFAKGKKLQSIFKSHWADGKQFSVYFNDVMKIANAEFANVLSDKKDINTALRDADEQINQFLDQQTKK